jgi:ribosomal protein S18 acetylase RimI-like enzyme
MIFDRKAFRDHPADWFDREYWQTCDAWWMIVDQRKIGCCAFEYRRGYLYISTTGILPEFRGLGFGTLLKSWQICFARDHGFTRIVTNTRKSNRAMIRLNRKFGFRTVRVVPTYYDNPKEPTVVMELRLPSRRG